MTSETMFEPEAFARATPPPSDVADIASAQAAPVSTPSSEPAGGEYHRGHVIECTLILIYIMLLLSVLWLIRIASSSTKP